MLEYQINHYNDFCDALLQAGFSMGAANAEGIFTLSSYFTNHINWHTEDPDTDPWEWRMKVLSDRNDIAYSKFFFKKSGYITKEWYPYFYLLRRKNKDFYDAYEDGVLSHAAKRIYTLFADSEALPLHVIKKEAGFSREDKYEFDRAMIELQMGFYLTMCGRKQKVSLKGEEYGWSSCVYCKTEDFFHEDIVKQIENLTMLEAEETITRQILFLNPDAPAKKIKKFIYGF